MIWRIGAQEAIVVQTHAQWWHHMILKWFDHEIPK
jgi:hypothetical protein